MREMECCLLVWVSSTSFQTLLDNGGDGMLSPCLGLYYLLSGLRRIMGEMDSVSLSGPLLPAFRPPQDNGGDGCCLLVWVSTTSFQTLLDNGGDGMLSPCLGLYHLLSGLRRIMGGDGCLLVWVSTT